MPDKDLNDLTTGFRPLADQVLARWLVRHPTDPLFVTYTLRTDEEQLEAFRAGRSEVRHGAHQAHPPDEKSWAMDAVPRSLMKLPNWAPLNPLWWELGEIVVSLGLRWGGQWERPAPPPVGTKVNYLWDPGHIEWRGPAKVTT